MMTVVIMTFFPFDELDPRAIPNDHFVLIVSPCNPWFWHNPPKESSKEDQDMLLTQALAKVRRDDPKFEKFYEDVRSNVERTHAYLGKNNISCYLAEANNGESSTMFLIGPYESIDIVYLYLDKVRLTDGPHTAFEFLNLHITHIGQDTSGPLDAGSGKPGLMM